MTTGKIEVARKSKSGKTLGVKINGAWYSTDKWELEGMVGETITITEENTVSMRDGGSITYLNSYVSGTAQATPPATVSPGVAGAYDAEGDNVLLLEFVGRCMQTFQWTSSSLVAAQTRAKQCYELGQSILDGSIMTPETGPRTRPEAPEPDMPPTPPPAEGDDFDDDIPF